MLRNSRRLSSPRRGSALVGSLSVVMVAAALGSAMLQMEAGFGRSLRQSVDNKRALYVAEAGLSEAYLAVVQGKGGTIGSSEHPAAFADGVFWVVAKEHLDNKVTLTSHGLCASGRFSVAMTIEPNSGSVGQLGLFGGTRVEVGGASVVDGYDSARGTFESQANTPLLGIPTTGGGARVNSNGNIALHASSSLLGISLAPTTVYGEVHPGPGGAVLQEPGVNVTGSTVPRTVGVSLPEIDVPVIASSGDILHRSGIRTIGPGEVAFANVRAIGGARIDVVGPATVVLSKLTIDPRAELRIDTTAGPVGLFCTESFILSAGSRITGNAGRPTDLGLFIAASEPFDRTGDGVPDPPVEVKGTGSLYGLLYAPETDLLIPEGLRVFGSVVGKSLTLAPKARLTVDKSPAGSALGLAGIPKFVCWKVVPLPPVPLVQRRGDPLVALKAAGITPTPSAQAAPERNISLAFLDLSRILRTFKGPAASVDWTQVALVKSVSFTDLSRRSAAAVGDY